MNNRELKFRAWDDRNKMWLFSYNHPNLGGFSMKGEVMLFGEYQRFLERVPLEDWSKIILMQYTGLKDKNGNEIYDGDILSFIDFDFNSDDEFLNYGLVEYYVSEMRFFITNRNSVEMDEIDFEKEVEIIGNIYENPELLNK